MKNPRESYCPRASRSASGSGRPTARISACVRAMSYATRRKLARPRVEIEQQPGGARVAVPRLPDRAGVEQAARAGELELGARRREPALAHAVAQRDLQGGVAVADERESGVRQRERRRRSLVREHVLPDRVASAAVIERHACPLALRLERVEVGAGLRA